ncbi:MAG: hypothetical protein WA751_07400 [Candidatus Dormiibacterota bacterium]
MTLPPSWQAAITAAASSSMWADPDYPSGAPPFAVTSDGGFYFAAEYTASWSGVIQVDAATQ